MIISFDYQCIRSISKRSTHSSAGVNYLRQLFLLSLELTHTAPDQFERRSRTRAPSRFEPPIAHLVVRDKEMFDFVHDSRVQFGE